MLCFAIASLRWYYPDQVHGVATYLWTLSLRSTPSDLAFFLPKREGIVKDAGNGRDDMRFIYGFRAAKCVTYIKNVWEEVVTRWNLLQRWES